MDWAGDDVPVYLCWEGGPDRRRDGEGKEEASERDVEQQWTHQVAVSAEACWNLELHRRQECPPSLERPSNLHLRWGVIGLRAAELEKCRGLNFCPSGRAMG